MDQGQIHVPVRNSSHSAPRSKLLARCQTVSQPPSVHRVLSIASPIQQMALSGRFCFTPADCGIVNISISCQGHRASAISVA